LKLRTLHEHEEVQDNRDIKRSRGGLRDIQSIFAVAKSLDGLDYSAPIPAVHWMERQGMLTASEAGALLDALEFMLAFRHELHQMPLEFGGYASYDRDTFDDEVLKAIAAADPALAPDGDALRAKLGHHMGVVAGLTRRFQERALRHIERGLDDRTREQLYAALSPELDEARSVQLAVNPNPLVRLALALNRRASPTALETVFPALPDDPDIGQELGSHPNLPAAMQWQMAQRTEPLWHPARLALATADSTVEEVVEHLLQHDPHAHVKKRAAINLIRRRTPDQEARILAMRLVRALWKRGVDIGEAEQRVLGILAGDLGQVTEQLRRAIKAEAPDSVSGSPSNGERMLQWRLRRQGLFREPMDVDGRPVSVDFAGGSLETARQVARLLLASEERLRDAGLLSAQEAELLRRHRAHEETFTRAIQRLLWRNPWSLVARDAATGEIVGVVFSALVQADTAQGLPATSAAMTRAHAQNAGRLRNAYVDFWFTGRTKETAKLMLEASLQAARALQALGDPRYAMQRLFAYSNPRGLARYSAFSAAAYRSWQEQDLEHRAGVSLTQYRDRVERVYRALVLSGAVRDSAIGTHLKGGAALADVKSRAFPLIDIGVEELNAIGGGYAYIMEYDLGGREGASKEPAQVSAGLRDTDRDSLHPPSPSGGLDELDEPGAVELHPTVDAQATSTRVVKGSI
jgi:hypothetical protein